MMKKTKQIAPPKDPVTDPDQARKDSRAEFRAGLLLLYFFAAFAATVYATERHALTYGQISFIYLPMFFLFIYWLIQRVRNAETRCQRVGSMVAIGMCIFIIVVTVCVSVFSWQSIL